MEGNGDLAGGCSTAPVRALNCEPWHGHLSLSPLRLTVQCWWVQDALNATTLFSEGRATMAACPPMVTDLAPPTGTSDSEAIVVPEAGWAVGAGWPPDPEPD